MKFPQERHGAPAATRQQPVWLAVAGTLNGLQRQCYRGISSEVYYAMSNAWSSVNKDPSVTITVDSTMARAAGVATPPMLRGGR